MEDWIYEKSGKIFRFSLSNVIIGILHIGLDMIIFLVKKYIFITSRKNTLNIILFNYVLSYLIKYNGTKTVP